MAELAIHMDELRTGVADKKYEIGDFAKRLHIHPRHLSNVISKNLHRSPCDIYLEALIDLSKELILSDDRPIYKIADQLTIDRANFGRFFKRHVGLSPMKFRQQQNKN